MKKNIKNSSLIITTLLFVAIFSLSTSLKLHPSPTHQYIWISADKSSWIGYLPQCEFICLNEQQGQVCDSNPKICCEKGQCVQKYNLTICNEPVKHFKCDRGNHMHYDNQEYFYKNVPEIKKIMHPNAAK